MNSTQTLKAHVRESLVMKTSMGVGGTVLDFNPSFRVLFEEF
jgi:hypothetical protein